jgi:hypothetical protein
MRTIATRNEPCLAECPNCSASQTVMLLISASSIRADMLLKPKGDFKEVMQKIKTAHRYDRKAKIKDY